MGLPPDFSKRMTLSRFHVQPRPSAISTILCGGPAGASNFTRKPSFPYPTNFPSGDQNGSYAY
jgi:hypothetical protein